MKIWLLIVFLVVLILLTPWYPWIRRKDPLMRGPYVETYFFLHILGFNSK